MDSTDGVYPDSKVGRVMRMRIAEEWGTYIFNFDSTNKHLMYSDALGSLVGSISCADCTEVVVAPEDPRTFSLKIRGASAIEFCTTTPDEAQQWIEKIQSAMKLAMRSRRSTGLRTWSPEQLLEASEQLDADNDDTDYDQDEESGNDNDVEQLSSTQSESKESSATEEVSTNNDKKSTSAEGLLPTSKIIKQGVLEKRRGGLFNVWQSRLFVLQHHSPSLLSPVPSQEALYYYKNEREMIEENHRGIIPLSSIVAIEKMGQRDLQSDENELLRTFCVICQNESSSRMYALRAETTQECQEWVSTVNNLIKKYSSMSVQSESESSNTISCQSTDSSAIKTGWLKANIDLLTQAANHQLDSSDESSLWKWYLFQVDQANDKLSFFDVAHRKQKISNSLKPTGVLRLEDVVSVCLGTSGYGGQTGCRINIEVKLFDTSTDERPIDGNSQAWTRSMQVPLIAPNVDFCQQWLQLLSTVCNRYSSSNGHLPSILDLNPLFHVEKTKKASNPSDYPSSPSNTAADQKDTASRVLTDSNQKQDQQNSFINRETGDEKSKPRMTHQGYLKKKSNASRHIWQKRLFVIWSGPRGYLAYYSNEKAFKNGVESGRIDWNEVSHVHIATSGKGSGKRLRFNLTLRTLRVFELIATSAVECEEWVNRIQSESAAAQSQLLEQAQSVDMRQSDQSSLISSNTLDRGLRGSDVRNSDISPRSQLPMRHGIVLEGWLRKKSPKNRHNWQRRFFALVPYTLLYYKEPGHKKLGQYVGKIDLSEIACVRRNTKGKGSSSSCRFDLELKSSRVLELMSPTARERRTWVEAFSHFVPILAERTAFDDFLDISLKTLSVDSKTNEEDIERIWHKDQFLFSITCELARRGPSVVAVLSQISESSTETDKSSFKEISRTEMVPTEKLLARTSLVINFRVMLDIRSESRQFDHLLVPTDAVLPSIIEPIDGHAIDSKYRITLYHCTDPNADDLSSNAFEALGYCTFYMSELLQTNPPTKRNLDEGLQKQLRDSLTYDDTNDKMPISSLPASLQSPGLDVPAPPLPARSPQVQTPIVDDTVPLLSNNVGTKQSSIPRVNSLSATRESVDSTSVKGTIGRKVLGGDLSSRWNDHGIYPAFVQIQFQEQRPLTTSSHNLVENKSYIFRNRDDRLVICHEKLEQSPFTFTVPSCVLNSAAAEFRELLHVRLQALDKVRACLDSVPPLNAQEKALMAMGMMVDPTQDLLDCLDQLDGLVGTCQSMLRQCETLSELFENYSMQDDGSPHGTLYQQRHFKSSMAKADVVLRHVATNLHIHTFSVYVRDYCTRSLKSHKIMTTTVGAFAAHALGFKQGDPQTLEAKLSELLIERVANPSVSHKHFDHDDSINSDLHSTNAIDSQTDVDHSTSIDGKDLSRIQDSTGDAKNDEVRTNCHPRPISYRRCKKMEVEVACLQRKLVVFSQALSALVSCFCSTLLKHLHEPQIIQSYANLGFLVEIESLLSSINAEEKMLSDMWWGVEQLQNVKFIIKLCDKNETHVGCPHGQKSATKLDEQKHSRATNGIDDQKYDSIGWNWTWQRPPTEHYEEHPYFPRFIDVKVLGSLMNKEIPINETEFSAANRISEVQGRAYRSLSFITDGKQSNQIHVELTFPRCCWDQIVHAVTMGKGKSNRPTANDGGTTSTTTALAPVSEMGPPNIANSSSSPSTIEEIQISVHPFFVTQGVNEMQSLALAVGGADLQRRINHSGVTTIKEYAHRFVELGIPQADFGSQEPNRSSTRYSANVQRPSNTNNSQIPRANDTKGNHHTATRQASADCISKSDSKLSDADLNKSLQTGLLTELNILEALMTRDEQAKNLGILERAREISRRMHAGRIVCCKSAKDRTSMSVTWEHACLIKDMYQIEGLEFKGALDVMRSVGVRRANVLKNTNKKHFAFNAIQRSMLPPIFCPPAHCCGKTQS